jgi:outer membrane lipoprotein SlyB
MRAKIVTTYPIPVIGGESGGAAGGGLAFGADGATGSRTFSATVTNPVAGAYYTAFTSTELDGTFRAECIVQAKDGDEVIPLGVDATAPSKFVIIVVSATPFNIGDPLPVDGK